MPPPSAQPLRAEGCRQNGNKKDKPPHNKGKSVDEAPLTTAPSIVDVTFVQDRSTIHRDQEPALLLPAV